MREATATLLIRHVLLHKIWKINLELETWNLKSGTWNRQRMPLALFPKEKPIFEKKFVPLHPHLRTLTTFDVNGLVIK